MYFSFTPVNPGSPVLCAWQSIIFITLCLTEPDVSVSALGLAEATEHRSVDALLPDLQETALPLGPASWTSR